MQFPTSFDSRSQAHSAGVDAEELRRVVRLCGPGGNVHRPITFIPNGDFSESWDRWMQELFFDLLMPRFLRAMELARLERGRDLVTLDEEIGALLPEAARLGSVKAGRKLLDHLRPARGLKWLNRFGQDAAGQFATSYAVSCALFNVGTWNALLAFLCEEHAGALGVAAWDLPMETEAFAGALRVDTLRLKFQQTETGFQRFQVA